MKLLILPEYGVPHDWRMKSQLITLEALGKVLVLESNSVAFIDVIRRLLCSNKNPISIFTQDLRVGIYLFVLGFLLPRTKGP